VVSRDFGSLADPVFLRRTFLPVGDTKASASTNRSRVAKSSEILIFQETLTTNTPDLTSRVAPYLIV